MIRNKYNFGRNKNTTKQPLLSRLNVSECCSETKNTTFSNTMEENQHTSGTYSSNVTNIFSLSIEQVKTNRRKLQENIRILKQHYGNCLTKNMMDPEHGVFYTRHEVLSCLNKGSYGVVEIIMDRLSDRIYVSKTYSLLEMEHENPMSTLQSCKKTKKIDVNEAYKEVLILSQINSPFIIDFHKYYHDIKNRAFHMIFEYSRMGEVIKIPSENAIPVNLIRKYMRDIICAIKYLHDKSIVHCDIKPANILIFANATAKLGDFGSAIMSKNISNWVIEAGSKPKTTISFCSPELLQTIMGTVIDLTKIDIWAFGVTLYCMASGSMPWNCDKICDLLHSIKNKPVPPPQYKTIPMGLDELILRLLAKNPFERITINELMLTPWLTLGGKWPLIT